MLASTLVLASAMVNAAEPAVKPNIIFIMADDHTSQIPPSIVPVSNWR